MENSPCLPRNLTKTIQRNGRLWSKFPLTAAQYHQRGRSIWSRTDSKTPKTWTRVPILCGVERISHFGSIVGAWTGIFRRWRPPDQLQTSPSAMNTPAVITLPLSTFENMKMELTWRLDDCLDQAKWACQFFKWYKNYLVTKNFPETSLPLLLHSTCQHIQKLHHQNVELLWPTHPRIFSRWIPSLDFFRALPTLAGPRNEFCCSGHIFVFPFIHYLTSTVLIPFS